VEVDVSRAADTAAEADRAVDRKDRLLVSILDHELRRTLAVPGVQPTSLRSASYVS